MDEHIEALEKIITELKIAAELRGAELDTCRQLLVQQANTITELRHEAARLQAEVERLQEVVS